jgi:hypothetical protein
MQPGNDPRTFTHFSGVRTKVVATLGRGCRNAASMWLWHLEMRRLRPSASTPNFDFSLFSFAAADVEVKGYDARQGFKMGNTIERDWRGYGVDMHIDFLKRMKCCCSRD